jgi:hypothetical protein
MRIERNERQETTWTLTDQIDEKTETELVPEPYNVLDIWSPVEVDSI